MQDHGTIPSPPSGMAATVVVVIGNDCAAHVSAVHLVPRASVPQVGAAVPEAASAPGSSRAATVWSTQHGVYQRVWDCCGILMNEFDTIAYWQYNGGWVNYWSLHNAVAYHRETFGGWSLQYQNAWQQWSNGYQVNLAGNAGFSYQGIFDPTGAFFYNSYFNAIQVRGSGSWSCQWSYSWRNGAPGWHTQNWCS
jgi:hypothetical protein